MQFRQAAILHTLPSLNKQCTCRDADVAEDVEPESVQPLGNYAVQITWKDGFNQVKCLEVLHSRSVSRSPVCLC